MLTAYIVRSKVAKYIGFDNCSCRILGYTVITSNFYTSRHCLNFMTEFKPIYSHSCTRISKLKLARFCIILLVDSFCPTMKSVLLFLTVSFSEKLAYDSQKLLAHIVRQPNSTERPGPPTPHPPQVSN